MNARTVLVTVVVLGTVLRVAVAIGSDTGDWLYSDMANYDQVARNWQRMTLSADDTLLPPGYPVFLALLYQVSGHSLTLVWIVQALLGGATCLLAGLIARRLSGSDSAAVTAAAIVAIYPPLIYYGAILLTEAVAPFWWALTVWLLLRAVETGAKSGAALAGVSLSIVTLIRPNLLVIFPWILVFAWVACRPSTVRAISLSLIVYLATIPLLLIAVVANSHYAGRRAGLSTNGGLNFFMMQADVATLAATNGNWSPLRNMIFYSGVFRAPVPSHDERFFYRQGWARLSQRRDTLAHTLRNLKEGFGLGEQGYWPANNILRDEQQSSTLLRRVLRLSSGYFFWLLALPLLLDVCVAISRRRIGDPRSAPTVLVVAMLVGMAVTSVTFLADPRMHVPFDAVFIAYVAALGARLLSPWTHVSPTVGAVAA